MFRIGEFSKIARVSGRLLRYYDQIGLFEPMRIDAESGYRYYSAEQLPCLNRILAYKEMGLTLDQIARLLNDDLSVDEMRGMLTMQKAEIEQKMVDELARIRSIEFRLEQIDREGMLPEYDIVLKSIPAQQLLSIRQTLPSLEAGFGLLGEVVRALPAQVSQKELGHFMLLFHSEMYEVEDIDVEMGFILTGDFSSAATLSDGRQFAVRDVSAQETVATYVAQGSLEYSYIAYNAIGTWMEANGYRFAGPLREEILQMAALDNTDELVREVQIPVHKRVA